MTLSDIIAVMGLGILAPIIALLEAISLVLGVTGLMLGGMGTAIDAAFRTAFR